MAKDGLKKDAQDGPTQRWREDPKGIVRAAIVLAFLLLLPSLAQAEIRFSVSPMKIHLAMDAGSQQVKTIEVYNGSDVSLRITTSLSDWATTANGGMNFSTPASEPRSASAWVRLDVGEFTLAPREGRVVRLLADLPDSSSGSYWAIVFFEGEAPARAKGVSVTSKARIGCTIYVTATGTEQRGDSITRMEIVSGNGPNAIGLQIGLANGGNVYYYPAGWIQVATPDGVPIFEEKLPYRVLLPGRETIYRFDWVPTAAGSLQFLATFDLQQETLLQGVLQFAVPDSLIPAPPAVLRGKPTEEPAVATGDRAP